MSIQTAFESVLAEHLRPLPPPKKTREAPREPSPGEVRQILDDREEALLLRLAIMGNGRFSVMKRDRELARLTELVRSARNLCSAFAALDMNARWAMTEAARAVPPERLRQPRRRGQDFLLLDLFDLPEVMRDAVPAARAAIRNAEEAGKVNWRAVSLLLAAREVWLRRRGRPAPRHVNPATRWGCFMEALFDAAKIEVTPKAVAEAAMRAGVLTSGRKIRRTKDAPT